MTRYSFMLIVIACIIFAAANTANSGTIRCVMLDGKNNRVEDAQIKIVDSDNKEFSVKIEPFGRFKSTNLPFGRYTISAYKEGNVDLLGIKSVVVLNGIGHTVRIRMVDIKDRVKKVESLLQHVSESVGKRYHLEETVIDALRQSILETIKIALKQDKHVMSAVLKTGDSFNIEALEALLSHPDCKEAIAKHLTDTQLQDYIDFTTGRWQRGQQAIIHVITAYLDHALSLTVDQRKKVKKILYGVISDDPWLIFVGIPEQTLHETARDMLHNEDNLNIFLNDILTQTQSDVWQKLIDVANKKYKADLVAVEFFDPSVEADKINEKEANKELNETEKQYPDEVENDPPKSQIWMLAEAVLAAHTGQLGPLNDNAIQQLTLIIDRVIEQYLQSQDEYFNTWMLSAETLTKLMIALENNSITREEVLRILNVMREDLWGDKATNKPKENSKATGFANQDLYGQNYINSALSGSISDIINHPLYQQTIKDVLSEDTYTQYIERQNEKLDFLQQASRDLVVAIIDMGILLDNIQRQQLELIASQLTLPSMSDTGLVFMFLELFLVIDPEMLSPWQRGELKLRNME